MENISKENKAGLDAAEENRKAVKGKEILVVGMGRSGVASARTLHELGAKVTCQDSKTRDKIDPKLVTWLEKENIPYIFGASPDNVGQYDTIVLSPGVASDLEFLCTARDMGVEVIGELEMAYRLSKGTYVGITGTNGKTTTTTLVGNIFRNADRNTAVVGNIGVAVMSRALESTDDEWMIAEVSSFQLETTETFRPHISAVLNLTPDHLNRHKTMERYGEAKAAVFKNQTEDDFLVINCDSREAMELPEKYGCRAKIVPFSRKKELEYGACLYNDRLVFKDSNGKIRDFCGKDELKIIGDHNIENALAAAAIGFCAGISPEIIGETIKAFPGVEHRIEYCGNVDGVKFYNDSKGTNTDAAIIAINAIRENIILIAGGDGKAQDFTEFAKRLNGPVKHLILLGRDGKIIGDAAEKAGFTSIFYEKDMNCCVRKAVELAEAGDNVLLSPACASWDMYDNYEQRGDHFKDCVNQLLK